MTTVDFITELFFQADEKLTDQPKHSQAKLHPSEVVTLALLFALKGSVLHQFLPLAPARLFRIVSQFAGTLKAFSPLQAASGFGAKILS